MSSTLGQRSSLALLIGFIAIPALAATTPSIIPARVSGFREIGAAFKAINDGVRSREAQTVLIQQSARQIRSLANQMPGWFPQGSGPAAGRTAAKPEIWLQPARFKAAQDAFIAQAARMHTAANSGNITAVRAEAAKLGATCKACHDTFRVPQS